jgi:hypothetical protein
MPEAAPDAGSRTKVADNDGPLLELPSVRKRLARRQRDLRERTLVKLIREECPHLADAKFNTAVLGLARTCLICHDLQARVYEETAFDSETGEVKRIVDTLLKSLGLTLKYCSALGLTPTMQSRLGLDAKPVTDLAAAFAELDHDGE